MAEVPDPPELQLYVYGDVPPEATILADPKPPAHDIGAVVTVAVKAVGCEMLNDCVAEHPPASVTVTE